MPKRSRTKPTPEEDADDMNVVAHRILAEATGELPKTAPPGEAKASEEPSEKNPAAVALGRLGGLKGGKARAASLSKKERSEIARIAAGARWKKG